MLRGSEKSWKKLSSGSKLLSVCTNSIYLFGQSKGHYKRKPIVFPKKDQTNLSCYVRVDQFVTYFTWKKNVRAQAQLVPEALIAHGPPEVPQTVDCSQSHEAVRVVSCFGCHVSLLRGSGQRQGGAGYLKRQEPQKIKGLVPIV